MGQPTASAVDELLATVLPRRSAADRTPDERARIRELIEELEEAGRDAKYLSSANFVGGGGYLGSPKTGGTLLWDNYEVAYFDRSLDGDFGSDRTAPRSPLKTLRSAVLGLLFRLRFSLQIVKAPNVVCNFVGFRFLGLPASVTARGTYTPLNATAVARARDEFGTELRADTSVRITFDAPRVSLCGLSFELSGGARQPPVDLCFTYVDERVRLGRAARGGRFVFTRGGLAARPVADEWEALLARRPVGTREMLCASGLAAAAFAARRARLVALPGA